MKGGEGALDRWVGVGEACRILGVRPATLRRWTKSGRVKAFVTPGGHRRFRASELLRFASGEAESGPRAGLQLGSLAQREQLEMLDEAKRQPWYRAFHVSDREQHRERGRRIVGLLEAYLNDETHRPAVAQEVSELAAEYGRQAARLGLSLRELLAAFHLFRRPLISAIDKLGDGDVEAKRGFFGMVTDVFDVFAAAMVEAYLEQTLEPLLGIGEGEPSAQRKLPREAPKARSD